MKDNHLNAEMTAMCALCGQVNPGVEYTYSAETGAEWESVCCGAHLIDSETGEDWNPEPEWFGEITYNHVVGGH